MRANGPKCRPHATKFDTGDEVKSPVPAMATDCHAHIFEPERFPYSADRRYTPPPADVESLRQMHASLGIERVVLVQPSVYGTDNRCLLSALRVLGDAGRGIAVVGPNCGRDELSELMGAGVCGVRINLRVGDNSNVAEAVGLLEKMEYTLLGTSLLVQLYASLAVLLGCAQTIRSLSRNVLVDHFGMPPAAAGTESRGFTELLDLTTSPNVWMKLSGPYQISAQASKYADVTPIAEALMQASPDRIVWGSDWPHTGGSQRRASHSPTHVEPFRSEDERHNLDVVAGSCTCEQRRKLLVDNAARLFGFSTG